MDSKHGKAHEKIKGKKGLAIAVPAAMLLVIVITYACFGSKYTREELIVKTGKKQIYGQLFRPGRGKSKYPLVILGHGYGGSYSDNLDYGQYLSSNGISCYVFDFCGGSENSKSSGNMDDMSVWTEIEDLNDIIDFMSEKEWLQEDGLFLAGKSLGGAVAALVGAERPDDVAGLILHYPYFVVPPAFGGDGNSYVVEDIFGKISRYKGRVLIFNGDQDKYVHLDYSQQAVEAYEDAELVVMKGSGHGFRGKARDQVKKRMVSFVLHDKY